MLRSSISYMEWVGCYSITFFVYRLVVRKTHDGIQLTWVGTSVWSLFSYLACWIWWWHEWKDAWSEVVVMMVMAEATTTDHHHHNHEYVQLYFLMPLWNLECFGRWYKTVNGESLSAAQTLPHSHYTENYKTVAQNGGLPEKCNSDLHVIRILTYFSVSTTCTHAAVNLGSLLTNVTQTSSNSRYYINIKSNTLSCMHSCPNEVPSAMCQ